MENQLVVFKLAREYYGVDIALVESIIKMQPLVAVPQAPDFVEGITNLRGVVLSVVDLRKRFGLPAVEASKDTRIIVVEINNLTVGMIVDAVTEVLRLQEEAIQPPPALMVTATSTFITGIAKIDERLVTLLDLKKVLSLEETTLLSTAELITV